MNNNAYIIMDPYLDSDSDLNSNLTKINDCHSSISDFPIDYNIFPLAKNCKMYTIQLTTNQYIFIPKFWHHWIYTEPNTLSIHYDIKYINFIDKNNDFITSLINNIPFYKLVDPIDNITYNEFINNSLDDKYRSIFSEKNDCIPVQKDNLLKFFYNTSLKNIINISKNKNYYTYIGHNVIDEQNILSKYKNIDYIINPRYLNKIIYNSSVWFTLDKKINSGLHSDPTNNVIYIIEGKKTIYLFNPNCKKNLYINEFPLIKTIH